MAKDKEKPKEEEEKDDKSAKKDKVKEESDKEGEEGAEGEGSKGGLKGLLANKKKLIIIVAALVILLAGGGGAAWFFLKKGDSTTEETPAAADAEHVAPAEGEKAEGHGAAPAKDEHGNPLPAPIPGAPVYYNMPEILVNLNTSGSKQTTLLKVAITLELANAQDTRMIDANLPRIQDSFNTYLREMRASDLSGSAGIYRLREELLLRINKIISPAKVNDILFKNILVQ